LSKLYGFIFITEVFPYMVSPHRSKESNFRGHVTQKAVVFNKDGDILLVRSDSENPWSILGGRVQDDEDADEGLKRELREETGLAVHVGQPVHAMTNVWFTDDGEPMFTVVYDCETNETEITLNHEHEEYEWVSPAEARDRMPIEPLELAIQRAITRRQ
jgi:8-oxo-dGTP pyrophosphatase MutT (NUDIX family)